MKFIIIGITDNPHPFFPPEVCSLIAQGRVFSGGRRHHEIVAPLLPSDSVWIDITAPLDGVFEQYEAHSSVASGERSGNAGRSAQCVTVFASGDPLFFGFANTVRRRMPEAEVVVYPSFNSLQLLAHRLVMPYHDMRIVSLTGRPWPELDRALIERVPKIGILTDREHSPAAIARRLLDYGYGAYTMHVGEHLGNPAKEHVTSLTLEEAANSSFGSPNCVILHLLPIATAPADSSLFTLHSSLTSLSRPFGIPDSEFALLDGRERMITKMPIRLLTLQALDLPRRQVLWDIGFCTGSVSIEARLQFPHLHVVAFEVRPECEAIIGENVRRHGTPGIEVHIGDFLSTSCEDIAAPDAVFIGGHGGHLKEIMAKVVARLLPGGIVVMNSVTPQSKQLFAEACQELGLVQEPSLRIALNDYNPIEIVKGRLLSLECRV